MKYVLFVLMFAYSVFANECRSMPVGTKEYISQILSDNTIYKYHVQQGVECTDGNFIRGVMSDGAVFCKLEDYNAHTNVTFISNSNRNILTVIIFDEYNVTISEKDFINQDKDCTDIYKLFKTKVMDN